MVDKIFKKCRKIVALVPKCTKEMFLMQKEKEDMLDHLYYVDVSRLVDCWCW